MLSSTIEESWIWATVACCLVTFLVRNALWPTILDSEEPPILRPKIPLIGHLIDLIRLGYKQNVKNHEKFNMLAYSLPILGGNLYVASSPQLASSIFQKRTLSFEPLIDRFVRTLVGMEGHGMELWTNPAFRTAIFKVLYKGLTGPSLNELTKSAVSHLATSLNKMPLDQRESIDFHCWTRETLSKTIMGGFYGKLSPWEDPMVMRSFWIYHDDMHKLFPGIAPSVIASKAYKARTKVIEALEAYIRSEKDFGAEVAQFTRDRFSAERTFEMSIHNSAKIEILLATALANVSTLVFWLLSNIYSQPELLAKIREELINAAVTGESPNKGEEVQMTLHLGKIKEHCPLLLSCAQETERHYIVDNIVRTVMSDTTISDGNRSYLLRKGNNVQMPLSILHNDARVWGANPESWKGDRFLNMGYNAASPPGFLPFGGGKHICPGRHLANGLLLNNAAQLLLSIDLESTDGGTIQVPEAQVPWSTTGIGRPEHGPESRVKISRRKDWEHVKWSVVY
ncbi:prostacyclin synthase [Colletotrichum orchidophilum]|uniref:Prostacyclin synthase n=1 Tax=Colletotrichum orchidophilum TaxID=1209926 RepID=A0A1G4BQM8_9PEZI|nr:prostacyclin synthase [Colletotrichum orchidophilum]OHF03754.1 prostacyclin synthase [Colletotrichum orchidophilum]